MKKLQPTFETDNVVTPFRWADCDKFVTRIVGHHCHVESVEGEIPGIWVKIYSSTTCPRCHKQLNYVHFQWKTKCHYCGLWMAYIRQPRSTLFQNETFGDLLIWDEAVVREQSRKKKLWQRLFGGGR